MAIYNEILVGRYARALQKLFSMKGDVPVKQLSGEVMAVLPLFFGAEARTLEGWAKFGQDMLGTAVAAQTTNFQVRNPVKSNVIAVIEKILWANNTAAADQPFMQVAAKATDLAGIFVITNSRFDPRGQGTTALILSGGNNVASIGGTKAIAAIPANTSWDFISTDIQEFPLLPGDALMFTTTAVNIAPNVSVWWRERSLEESELTAG